MRISVNLNEETLKRVDEEAKKLGTSRGAMLTAWIGEKLMNLDMSRSWFRDEIPEKIIKAFANGLFEQQMKEISLENGSPEIVEEIALLKKEREAKRVKSTKKKKSAK